MWHMIAGPQYLAPNASDVKVEKVVTMPYSGHISSAIAYNINVLWQQDKHCIQSAVCKSSDAWQHQGSLLILATVFESSYVNYVPRDQHISGGDNLVLSAIILNMNQINLQLFEIKNQVSQDLIPHSMCYSHCRNGVRNGVCRTLGVISRKQLFGFINN